MAVNRQKIWQINFNKYNAVGGGLKCCHPLNYKNTTVNQSPPHVGERGNFLWIAQKHTRNTSCILSTVSAKSSYAMPLSTHGATGTGGGKEKYPLNNTHQWRACCSPVIFAREKEGNHLPLFFRELHTAGNRDLWRDFLNFPYFTGFPAPLDSEMICILRLYPNGIIIMDMNIVGGHMNIQNEKVNTKLLYSVGYVPEVDKYILSCVVTWVAWYNRYYEITKEEYEAFGTERLDQLASRFRELECKSDRFLFSDRDEENTTEQNALRTGMKQKEIFYNVHKLLDKAQIPVSYQIESFKRMIDNSKFDMELKIDIMEYRTRVFCYERGTLVFEKYVDDRTLLEYLILNEVVCSYFCVLAGKQHVKTDGYIDMDWERKSEKDAFAAIGDPYKTMYEEGISIFKI